MVLKTVTDRVRRAQALHAGLQEHHDTAAEEIVKHLAAYTEEGEDLAGSVDLLLRVVERRVAASPEELESAEDLYSVATTRVDDARKKRDEASQKLRDQLIEIREVLAIAIKRETGNKILGLDGDTARAHNPGRLLKQAQKACRRLADPGRKLPKPKVPGASELEGTWRKDSIQKLETGCRGLEEALKGLQATEGEAKALLDLKDEEVATQDRELSAIAHLQEALLVLGMQLDLARNVWKEQRKAGRPRHRNRQTDQQENPGETASTSD
jgi:hypothetical protein